MTYFILITVVGCAWAVLRVVGGERERQLQVARVEAAHRPAAPPVPIARSANFKVPAGMIAPSKSAGAPSTPATPATPVPGAAKPAR